ncbi:MAG: zinc metalloprotease [Propionibacteriaceae bacterium]
MIMLMSPAGTPFRVARVGRVPISVGHSWPYLLVVLLLVLLADGDLTAATITAGSRTALLWWACLMSAVVIHELGHLLMSLVLRVPAHPVVLDVWAGHVHTPDPYGPGRAILVAIAGPLANLVTALVSYNNREVAGWSAAVVPFMVLNLGMFVYHVLPGLPQDGGVVVSAVVKWVTQSETSGMEVGAWAGRFVIFAAAAVFIGGPLVMTRHLPRLVDMAWVGGLVYLLWRTTSDLLTVVRRRHLTDQILTRNIVRPTETVPRHTRLDITDATYQRGCAVLVLDDSQEPVGVLVVGAGGPHRRDVRTAGDVMLPAPGPDWVTEAVLDDDISDTADALVASGYPVMAVRTETGRYGLVWRTDLDREVGRRGSVFGPRRVSPNVRYADRTGSQP